MSRPERMRRIDEAMKQVLSEGIPTLKDPRIGFVTVTAVETSRDLDHAKVWVSVFGNDRQRQKTLEALHKVRELLVEIGVVTPTSQRLWRWLGIWPRPTAAAA